MITLVVSLTKKPINEFKKTPLGKSIEVLCEARDSRLVWDIKYENSTPICKAYNDSVRKHKEFAPDLFLFVHDDVSIEDSFIST